MGMEIKKKGKKERKDEKKIRKKSQPITPALGKEGGSFH